MVDQPHPMTIPSFTSERLKLRPFSLRDAPRVRQLAGAWEIAQTTANIPHPYEEGMAEEWITTHAAAFEENKAVTFAIELRLDEALIGAISLMLHPSHDWAEMGYWIGKPYWNLGYCTEAAREVVRYGFEDLDLNRIQARHMSKNPASGRVMQKLGMQLEGTLRQSLKRFGELEDAVMYSILREEYDER